MKLLLDEKITTVFETLRDSFSWSNPMQAIHLEKVVVSVGVGRMRKEKDKIVLVQDRLAKITGQKAAPRKAKKSIASFKLREGEVIGYVVTLRGKKMRAFLDRVVNVALPRMRDFRGISRTSVDVMGNLTIGVPEHTVFPETPDENMQDVFGLSVTIVSSATDKEHALTFFEHLGIPFARTA